MSASAAQSPASTRTGCSPGPTPASTGSSGWACSTSLIPTPPSTLEGVYRTLRDWGVGYHKLDFLYAGAIGGIDAYQEGLRIVRRGAGDDAVLVGCGAPLLPSIGLVDAMRVGPDVLPETPGAEPDLEHPIRITNARRWMNGRLWVSDPDTLVARAEIAEREAWAAHVAGYGGLAFSSDRLAALDERGLELTRAALQRSMPLAP